MRRTPPARESARAFAGLLVFVIVTWTFVLFVLRAGAPDPLDDTWEYGVVSRALLQGRGFHTLVIHPPLWSLHDSSMHVPVLVHGPLLPVLMLPMVALGGPHAPDGVATLAALFAVLAAVATFRLGERLHSTWVGLAAAVLLTLSPHSMRSVQHDPALLVGMAFLAMSAALLVDERPRGALAGAALGLGALARPEFVPIAALFVLLARGQRAPFVLAFLLMVAPWMMHTALATGSPVFNLSSYLAIGYWGDRPGIGVMRDFAIPPSAWPATLAAEAHDLPRKWLEFFPPAARRWLSSPSGATGWLVLPGWLMSLALARRRGFALVAIAAGLAPLAIMTLTLYDERYMAPFLPLSAVGAAIGARELMEWAPGWLRRPRAWIGLLVLAMLPSAGPAAHEAWRDARETRARLASERAMLLARAASPADPASVLAYSDTPDFVAWTLARPVVWTSAEEHAALPAWDGLPPAPHEYLDRPRRTASDFTWFHAAEGRGAPLAPAAAAHDTTTALPDSVRALADSLAAPAATAP